MNEHARLCDTFRELAALLLSCADWRRSWYKLRKLRRGRWDEVNTWKTWKSSTHWSSQGGCDIYEVNPQGRLVFSFRLSRCPCHMVALDFSLISHIRNRSVIIYQHLKTEDNYQAKMKYFAVTSHSLKLNCWQQNVYTFIVHPQWRQRLVLHQNSVF